MIDNTINDNKTIVGGCEGMFLAGRYNIFAFAVVITARRKWE